MCVGSLNLNYRGFNTSETASGNIYRDFQGYSLIVNIVCDSSESIRFKSCKVVCSMVCI